MKHKNLLIATLALGFMLAPPSIGTASMECFRHQQPDTVVCPPPNGEIIAYTEGDYACGTGWCVADAHGNVKCSRVPGGAAIVDQRGNALCVGGCMDPSPSLCRTIERPNKKSR